MRMKPMGQKPKQWIGALMAGVSLFGGFVFAAEDGVDAKRVDQVKDELQKSLTKDGGAEAVKLDAKADGSAGEKPEDPAAGMSAAEKRERSTKLGEVRGFLDLAKRAIEEKKEELASHYLESIANIKLTDADKKDALISLAEAYEEKKEPIKAIQIYEKVLKLLENDGDAPEWLFRLGKLYRETNSMTLSVNRFYAVLNSVVKVSGRGFENYVAITRKAQREIADTYFMMGDFPQAQKFYNLMLRTELSEDEKPLIMFKAGHCTFMRDDMAAAMVALEKFIREYPGHDAAPEARYLLAVAQRAQGRTKEAYDTVLDLLRYQRDKKESDPEKWIFWQKKAGNEFANDYYQRADFVNAVTIYQVLSTLNEAADWRWPIVYQMGLCFERLRLEPRAHECYQHITESAKKFAGTEMPKSLEILVQMAGWRDGQLDWSRKSGTTLNSLLGAEIKPITVNPAPTKVTR